MSIATLNRITREQTVFYNTKRERDIKTQGSAQRTTQSWKQWEIDLLRKNPDKSAKWLQQYIPRTYMCIWHQLKNLRLELNHS